MQAGQGGGRRARSGRRSGGKGDSQSPQRAGAGKAKAYAPPPPVSPLKRSGSDLGLCPSAGLRSILAKSPAAPAADAGSPRRRRSPFVPQPPRAPKAQPAPPAPLTPPKPKKGPPAGPAPAATGAAKAPESPKSPGSGKAKQPAAAAGSPAAKKRKSVGFSSEPPKVAVFKPGNPANFWGDKDYDWAAAEAREEKERRKKKAAQAVAAGAAAGKGGAQEQVFSVFAIPAVMDTAKLTRADLVVELKARGLPVAGEKDELRKRLEQALRRENNASPTKKGAKRKGGALAPALAKRARKQDDGDPELLDVGFTDFKFDQKPAPDSDDEAASKRASTGSKGSAASGGSKGSGKKRVMKKKRSSA
eukprot:TRINITY_DN15456_c0_g1_i1.p1 TRINITY_DN15456_c0_g1~~TRINITY_DN15456_c0_g1_i1.p1  ORF type:complete len:390 (+),score=117.96 TRINITY_DN15456_c0_g1_i1:90-1172(+)